MQVTASLDYQNYKCYIKETCAVQTAATVDFYPKHVQMLKTSSEDRLSAAFENVTEVLNDPHPCTPFLQEGTETYDAIQKLTKIFTYPPKRDANTSPRVPETVRYQTRVQPPRVARRTAPRVSANKRRLETIAETEHPIGTIIMRKINKKMQRGTVTRYNITRIVDIIGSIMTITTRKN